MMDLYIDKENLFSFLSCKDQEEYPDCSRLMKRHLHLIYGFEKTDISGWDEQRRLCFFNEIVDGRGWKEDEDLYDSKYFEKNPLKSIFSVFLLNNTHYFKTNKNIISGHIGDEVLTIKKLFCGEDYALHHEYNLQNSLSFPSCEQLVQDGHALPCSDILIRDRYLFNNPYDIVVTNVCNLIEVLTKSNEYQANIVFVTIGDKNTNWEKYIKEIKSRCNVNVTFVLAYPNPSGRGNIAKIRHDRIILTNYRRYFSGDSLLFFNLDGALLTTGDVFTVDSMADRNMNSLAKAFISNTQDLCNKIHEKEFGFAKYIVGDKQSNLIKF